MESGARITLLIVLQGYEPKVHPEPISKVRIREIMSENPLVSFCVKCYNQADLIAPALQAAFVQTYRPMEIVISDDCSRDGSVDVIERMIAEYRAKGGDIPITFLRQTENQGNLGNWQRICEVAKGELLIKADGDDISLPNRTEEVVKAWVAAGRKPLIVYHGAIKINGRGNAFGHCKKSVLDYGPVGAVSAYSRRLFDEFGAIVVSNPRTFDDTVYGGRARILDGDCLWVEQELVKYRVGSGVSSGICGYRAFMARGAYAGLLARQQTLADLETCKVALLEEKKRALRSVIQSEMSVIENQVQLWQGTSVGKRLEAFRRLKPTIHGLVQQIIHRLLLLGCLSDPIFDLIKIVKYMMDRVSMLHENARCQH